jgi:hypothetical protein
MAEEYQPISRGETTITVAMSLLRRLTTRFAAEHLRCGSGIAASPIRFN